jgi:hypothetical protein
VLNAEGFLDVAVRVFLAWVGGQQIKNGPAGWMQLARVRAQFWFRLLSAPAKNLFTIF